MDAVYSRHLAGHSEPALNFLAREATATCRFFPTPSECIEIIGRWERRDEATQAKAMAATRARQERQQRLDDLRSRIDAGEATPAEVAAQPGRIRAILETEGRMRWNEDETFALRSMRPWMLEMREVAE